MNLLTLITRTIEFPILACLENSEDPDQTPHYKVSDLGLHCCLCPIKRTPGFVGPQNAPLHNMHLLVAYCVPCIHNMLRWSILCTLHTQYATSGAYCVGSIHMLFQWSSEGTQYALLENISRGICLSF